MTARIAHKAAAFRPPLEWTDGPDCPAGEATLGELLAAPAGWSPDAVAVRQWDDSLTFRELVDSATALAGELRDAGVGPEARVGICVRRSLDLPVAVLGVLLAGGAYVPLDPGHPQRRLAAIADDAGIELVVADAAGRDLLARTGRRLIAPAGHRTRPPRPCPARADHAAYVLYTSGTTGRPKGVVVSHRAAVAFGAAVRASRPTGPGCRSAGFASLGFDTSLFDFLHPLATGATVALLPEADRTDPQRLQRFLAEHRVTRAMIPPPLLPLLEPAALPELAELFVAGEPCGPEQVARWAVPGRRFFNWYGPTETTVIVTGIELSGQWSRPLPIGRPLPGCRAVVLDELLRPCPPGEPGELCIGGPQLARGYLGRPGLTAQRFVPDPTGGEPGARLYRTGDRVTWLPDGRISFLGRFDRQVKIHGQRVEIGEIETVLSGHPGVRQVVVDAVRDSAGEVRLDAYLTPADGPDLTGVREHCARVLPDHMIPNRVLRRAELPLTVAGKVDLAALRAQATGPDPDRPPTTAAPDSVAAVWAEVFDGPVPLPDNDFLGAGGHSLLAMRLVSALRSRLGRQVEVADVYAARTVAALTELIRSAAPLDDDPVPRGSAPALSPMQRRLWFVEQLNPGVPAHNIAMAERVRGPLNETALRTALAAVATRQEALRWRVPAEHGVPVVVLRPPGPAPLTVTDVSARPAGERAAAVRALLDRCAATPFDLAAGPLWRVELIRLGAREHVLAITVHHIVFDGWSADVLYRDLAAAYRSALTGAPPPGPLATGLADHVAWSSARLAARPPAAPQWWREHLAGVPLVLDLPRDRARPAVQTFHGARAAARIGPVAAGRVRALARSLDTTVFVVLLTAFGHLLGRLTGQSELVVGTPVADRARPEWEAVVGCCLQLLPLRLTVPAEAEAGALVRAARDELAAAVAHQDVPVDEVVAVLGGGRDLSRNPLVQVLFNLYNFATARLDLPDATAEPLDPGLPGSLYDLTLYAGEREDGFDLQAVYNPDLFDPERIDALLAAYVGLVERFTLAPDRPAAAAGLRTAADHRLPDPAAALPAGTGPDPLALIAGHAAAGPDRPAVSGAGGVLSRAELLDLSRRVTGAVRAAGVPADGVVAVLAARHVRLPGVLCGVLASGARWLVLDPATPPAVLRAALAAVPVRALIRLPGTPEFDAGVPELDIDGAAPDSGEPAADRGYYLLTSGSTGAPRPVLTTDRPLAHFLAWYTGTFELTGQDRFALLGGLAHDPLLRDALVPLVLGAGLGVPEPELLREPAALAAWLAAERTTVLHLTPQLARLLAGTGVELPSVRLAVLSGDQLLGADLPPLRRLLPAARVVNGYGTTETPQVQAFHEVDRTPGAEPAGLPVPVGHGIAGVQLVIRSTGGHPAGVGELGEVLIRGRHLATGYPDPAETARHFGGDPGDRWFHTGDLGRYRPDGAVVLAGRLDDQVKIRGYRVELGAVRAALAGHPDIGQAYVLATAEGGERRLRGFAVPGRAGVRAWQVRDDLRALLPEHALPAEIVLVPEFPLTRNGKIDREALARLAAAPARRRGGELTSPTQRTIAGVWSEVLGLPKPDANDNFFEVGGHSLAIVVVGDRLSRLFGRSIPVVDLFRHPTIRALAAHLDGADADTQVARAVARAASRRDRVRRRPAPRT